MGSEEVEYEVRVRVRYIPNESGERFVSLGRIQEDTKKSLIPTPPGSDRYDLHPEELQDSVLQIVGWRD